MLSVSRVLTNIRPLEFLADQEVELAAALLAVDIVVETVAPVDAEHTDDRQVDTGADTGGTLDFERIELPDVRPGVTAFEEDQRKDRGLRLEDDRITEFDRELVIDIARIGVARRVVLGRGERRQGVVVVTAESDDLGTVAVVARHAVAAELEALERRVAPLAVVVTQVTELEAGPQDQVAGQFRIEIGLEMPLVVLDPLVADRRIRSGCPGPSSGRGRTAGSAGP